MPLFDGINFYVLFGVSFPAAIFAGMQIGELWLDHLPPQVNTARHISHAPKPEKRQKAGCIHTVLRCWRNNRLRLINSAWCVKTLFAW